MNQRKWVPTWNNGSHGYSALYALIGVGSILVLLLLYNFAPGTLPDSAAGVSDMGLAKCIQNSPGLLNLYCPYVGYPVGSPSTFGLPLHALIANTSEMLSISIWNAYRLACSFLLCIAFVGCLKLFGKIITNPWLALIGALLFLISPIIALEGGYGALRLGFALLPTYIYIDAVAVDNFNKEKIDMRIMSFWLVVLIAMRTFALFMDGYSFVMALLVGGSFWLLWACQAIRIRAFQRVILGSLIALVSVGVPVFLYKYYIPDSHYAVMPVDLFRGQGIDLYTFFVPSSMNWVANITGWHHHISGYQVYSDGPSSNFVYLGYSFLICGIICVWALLTRIFTENRIIIPIFLVAIIAMMLSFGPSLKWHDLRQGAATTITYGSYLMPEGKATFELGTGWIYQHVPGIKIMRALYRWQLLVRLALVIAAISTLGLLIERKRYAFATILSIALFAETLPPVNHIIDAGHRSSHTLNQVETTLLPEIRANISRGSKAVFLQLHQNASQNPYLATYLCANADIYCYNVGGDKNTELAKDAWPAPVYELISGQNIAVNVKDIFDNRLADVIIVPFFDLRQQAYFWPPKNYPVSEVMNVISKQFSEYDVHVTTWFAFIKPKSISFNAEKHYALNNFVDGHVATVSNWGPRSISLRGRELVYIWVGTPDSPASVSVVVGDHVLATVHNSSDLLAAPVRHTADHVILRGKATLPVYLIDREGHRKQRLGDISITP